MATATKVEEPSDAKPFVRVTDKTTKHEFDVHYLRFDQDRYARVPEVEPSAKARRPKPHIDAKTAAAADTKETSK